jgi:hypothetical protein
MKRKFTAFLVMAALLLTMLPFTAFAADEDSDISIETAAFDSKTSDTNNYVLVIVKGAETGDRVSVYMEGVDDALYLGRLDDGENILYISKDDIPGIEEPYSANTLVVNVTNDTGDKILATRSFTKAAAATDLDAMSVTLTPSTDNKNVPFNIRFDKDYVPASGDRVRLTALDKDGNDIGAPVSVSISASDLQSDPDDDGFRALKNTPKATFMASAVQVRVEFLRDGKVDKDLTQTLSLSEVYGDYDHMDLVFDSDTVLPGQKVSGTLYYYNKDKKRFDVTDHALYVYSKTNALASKSGKAPEFTVAADAKEGDEITITAYYGNNLVQKKLTVGASSSDLAQFNRASVYAGSDVSLRLSITDADYNPAKLDFTPTKATASWQGSGDAKVAFTAAKPGQIANGVMDVTVNADKATSGVFSVTFSDNKGHSATLRSSKLTFKDPADKPEKRSVRMAIGSTEMLVNGDPVKMDTVPIITSDRTFVPLRALVEAFDADVEWSDKDRTVTVDYDGQTIIMTIGQTTYTINGESHTMDVAPFIDAQAGRTLVPVRFMAEAMGFDVTAQSRDDGTTASVLFEN